MKAAFAARTPPLPLAEEMAHGNYRMEHALKSLERDRDRHLLAPCTEGDLSHLESVLGWRLPDAYRQLLMRLGGGLYYDRHEIFGARRLMVHDIELVPDALTMRTWLAHIVPCAPPYLLPVHRAGNAIHCLDLRDGSVRLPVGGGGYADLGVFLQAVVLTTRPVAS